MKIFITGVAGFLGSHLADLMIELNNNSKKYGSSNLEIEKHLREIGFEIIIKIWPDVVWRKKGYSK